MSQPVKFLGPHAEVNPLGSLVLRRRAGADPQPASWPRRARWPRAELGQRWGADPADLDKLRAFARTHALRETGAHAGRRVLRLSGATWRSISLVSASRRRRWAPLGDAICNEAVLA